MNFKKNAEAAKQTAELLEAKEYQAKQLQEQLNSKYSHVNQLEQ